MKKGKLIVFEGIDGCGGETQTDKLKVYLEKRGYSVILRRYPNRDGIGKYFYDFIEGHSKKKLNLPTQVLIHAADRACDTEEIEAHLNEGGIWIADRWIHSMFAFQGCQDMTNYPIEKLVRIAEDNNILKPDMIFYLKISPETSIRRKHNENRGVLDIHEKDTKLQRMVSSCYDMMSDKDVYGKWIEIRGEHSYMNKSKSIGVISTTIERYVDDLL